MLPDPAMLAAYPAGHAACDDAVDSFAGLRHVNDPSAPEVDAPLRRSAGSAFYRPANLLARAIGWGFVRTLIGLLAAGILLFYAATTG